MINDYDEDGALITLEYLREGVYNDRRPSADIIPELLDVIILLDKRIRELNPGLA